MPPPPLLWLRGEGHTRLRERGWESPNSDKGTYIHCGTLGYMYFVVTRLFFGKIGETILQEVYRRTIKSQLQDKTERKCITKFKNKTPLTEKQMHNILLNKSKHHILDRLSKVHGLKTLKYIICQKKKNQPQRGRNIFFLRINKNIVLIIIARLRIRIFVGVRIRIRNPEPKIRVFSQQAQMQ